MKLYLITTNDIGYDTFDSFIVNEKNEKEAKKWTPTDRKENFPTSYCASITCIGKSDKNLKSGVVLASFNAG